MEVRSNGTLILLKRVCDPVGLKSARFDHKIK